MVEGRGSPRICSTKTSRAPSGGPSTDTHRARRTRGGDRLRSSSRRRARWTRSRTNLAVSGRGSAHREGQPRSPRVDAAQIAFEAQGSPHLTTRRDDGANVSSAVGSGADMLVGCFHVDAENLGHGAPRTARRREEDHGRQDESYRQICDAGVTGRCRSAYFCGALPRPSSTRECRARCSPAVATRSYSSSSARATSR